MYIVNYISYIWLYDVEESLKTKFLTRTVKNKSFYMCLLKTLNYELYVFISHIIRLKCKYYDFF